MTPEEKTQAFVADALALQLRGVPISVHYSADGTEATVSIQDSPASDKWRDKIRAFVFKYREILH